ncbi:hypothetical protein [Tautonia marina]|uniref:hypothetical protein n=1 Tax=Tautonia marina TaxID=2653855 RepID=UPI0012604E3F|nr:hypothetical protein [Tautonia marina]
MRHVIGVGIDGLIVFWVLLVGPFCWILRDGLGPDAVESQGMLAVSRWLGTFFWGPVLGGLVALRLIARWRFGA